MSNSVYVFLLAQSMCKRYAVLSRWHLANIFPISFHAFVLKRMLWTSSMYLYLYLYLYTWKMPNWRRNGRNAGGCFVGAGFCEWGWCVKRIEIHATCELVLLRQKWKWEEGCSWMAFRQYQAYLSFSHSYSTRSYSVTRAPFLISLIFSVGIKLMFPGAPRRQLMPYSYEVLSYLFDEWGCHKFSLDIKKFRTDILLFLHSYDIWEWYFK